MESDAQQLFREVSSIFAALAALPDLKPGPQVEQPLTRLVEICITPHSEAFASYVLSTDGVEALCAKLRPLCATAEGELEKRWTEQSLLALGPPLNQPSAREVLSTFPYYQNYLELSRIECSALEAFFPACSASCRPMAQSIAFIGSGPLPLSSFCLLERYSEAVVHNVDRDADAIRVSGAFAEALGWGDRMTWECGDVGGMQHLQTTNWKDFEVIFLAALVGMDSKSKIEILGKIAREAEPGTLVVVRTARALRSILYPVLELGDDLKDAGYEIMAVVHPWTKVVNSVVILKTRGACCS